MTDLQAIRDRIDLRDYHLAVVGSGKRSGDGLSDRVPWRDDQHPSLGVYPKRWKDFTTGEHGDIFDYIQRREGVDFRRAVEKAEQWSGVEPQNRNFRVTYARGL